MSEGLANIYFSPQAYSAYNGLAVQVNKRYSNHFQYIAAYTWSHMLDDASGTFSSTALTPLVRAEFPEHGGGMVFFSPGPAPAFDVYSDLLLWEAVQQRQLAHEEYRG